MATPPKISHEEATAALQRIIDRHRTWGGPRLADIGTSASEMLDYLEKHWSTFPDGIRCDDLNDAAMLHVWRWWQHQARERWWYDAVVDAGADRASFAAVFGIGSPAGFNNRRDRLHSLLDETGTGRPDEKAAMADRALRRQPAGEWIDHARERVLAVARELVDGFYMDVDEETAGELLEVRRDLRTGAYGPETVALVDAGVQAVAVCEVDGIADRAAALVQRWDAMMLERKLAGASA